VTTDIKDESVDAVAEAGDEKSFFARGAMVGMAGGPLIAILVMGATGSFLSLAEDVFGSTTVAEAESNEPLTGEALLVATGQDLTAANGCIGCHTTDGRNGTGPTWSGLAETVDEDYLRRAILEPNVDIAEGFSPDLMPSTYADALSDEDVDAIVAYLSSL